MPTRSHESFESVSSLTIYGSISANFRGLQSGFCSLCSYWFCCSRPPNKKKMLRRFRLHCLFKRMFQIQPLRMRLLMLTKSKLHFFYTRIKDQHHYLGQDQIQTGATSPSRDRRSEANSIYEIQIRLHGGTPLTTLWERENPTFQRRQIEGEEVLRPKITNPSPKSFLPNLTELP